MRVDFGLLDASGTVHWVFLAARSTFNSRYHDIMRDADDGVVLNLMRLLEAHGLRIVMAKDHPRRRKATHPTRMPQGI